MNNSIMTRKFERLLFDGIPEQPEAVYERDDNGNVNMRMSGRALASEEYDSKDSIAIGTYKYDLELGKITYVPNASAMEQLAKEIDDK